MQIQHCVAGQRVIYRENAKPGTISKVYLDKNEVDLVLDNGTRIHAHVRLIDPFTGDAQTGATGGPVRPCPQCAAKMPIDATTCPSCGFQYRARKSTGIPAPLKRLLLLIVAAAVAYVIWKFALGGKLPGH